MGHCQLDTELLQPQVMKRWLGSLPHLCHPAANQARPHPPCPSGCGDSGGSSTALEGVAGLEGKARGRHSPAKQHFHSQPDTSLDFFLPNLLCQVSLHC